MDAVALVAIDRAAANQEVGARIEAPQVRIPGPVAAKLLIEPGRQLRLVGSDKSLSAAEGVFHHRGTVDHRRGILNDPAPGDGRLGHLAAPFLKLGLAQQRHEVQPVDVEGALERHPLQLGVGKRPGRVRQVHPQRGLPRLDLRSPAKVVGGFACVPVRESPRPPRIQCDRVVGLDRQGFVKQPELLAELAALTGARRGCKPRLDFSRHIRHAGPIITAMETAQAIAGHYQGLRFELRRG